MTNTASPEVILAEQLEAFRKEYIKREAATTFKILGPWIKEISRSAALRTLPKGSRSFCLMLTIGTTGLSSTGTTLKVIQESLLQLVLKKSFDAVTPGSTLLLKAAIEVITIFVAAGTYLLFNNEQLPQSKDSSVFSLELLLEWIIETGLLAETYNVLLEACGAPVEKRQIGINVLSFATLTLILLMTKTTHKVAFEDLIGRMREKLCRFLEEILPNVGDIAEWSLVLREANAALQAGSSNGFIEAGVSALKRFNLSYEFLNNDLVALDRYIEQLINLLKVGGEGDVNKMTSLYQAG